MKNENPVIAARADLLLEKEKTIFSNWPGLYCCCPDKKEVCC
jgi:hypothetical protein